jgi:hypothetical protein
MVDDEYTLTEKVTSDGRALLCTKYQDRHHFQQESNGWGIAVLTYKTHLYVNRPAQVALHYFRSICRPLWLVLKERQFRLSLPESGQSDDNVNLE